MKKHTLTLSILLSSLLATTALACPEHEGAKPPCCKTMKEPCCAKMKDDEVCLKHLNKGNAHAGHGSHGAAQPNTNPAVAEYEAGMTKMHQDMAITYTGDPDYDFVAGMIPHHQGAIDMAQVVMKYGRDPQVRRLAQDVIRAQNLEIRWMKAYMKQLEARGLKPVAADAKPRASYTDKGWFGDTILGQW